MFDQEAIDAFNEKKQQEAERQQALSAVKEVTDKVEEVKKAVNFSTAKLISDRRVNPQRVEVLTQLATPKDIDKVVRSLDKLAVVLKPELHDDQPVIAAINGLRDQLKKLPSQMPEIEAVEEVTVKNIAEFKGYIKPLLDAVNKLELSPVFDPTIEVKPADVNVTTEKVNTEPLLKAIKELSKEFSKLSAKEQPATDLTPIIDATKATTKAINNLSFPVPNYILPFKDVNGKAVQVQLDSSGNVPTTTSGGTSTAVIDPRTGYAISDKEATATYKYFGFEDAGGKWYILRKTIATNDFLYAAGTSGYATAWTNRASQSYDTFDNTFAAVLGSVITSTTSVATYQSNPTATLSNVAGSASSVTLLASNTSRRGMTIYNDSSAVLYVKFGTTASTTSFTVKMAADTYYEAPFGYTGVIDGIWASATGSARITEIT